MALLRHDDGGFFVGPFPSSCSIRCSDGDPPDMDPPRGSVWHPSCGVSDGPTYWRRTTWTDTASWNPCGISRRDTEPRGEGHRQTMDFYRKAFGAVERMRMELPDTKRVVHGEVMIGDSIIMLGDEMPEHHCAGARQPQGDHRRAVRLRAGRRHGVQARHRGRVQGHDARGGHVLGRSRRRGPGPVRPQVESRDPQGRPFQGGDAQRGKAWFASKGGQSSREARRPSAPA